MRNHILAFGIISMFLLFTACNTDPCGYNTKAFITNFETFVQKIQDQDLPYNSQKWVQYDKQYTKFKDECYQKHKDKLTEVQDQEFWANSAKYYWLRYGSGFINQILDEESEVVDKIMDELRDAWNNSEEEMDGVFKDIQIEMDKVDKDKLNDLFKDMGKDVEEWGKKIEEIFKEK